MVWESKSLFLQNAQTSHKSWLVGGLDDMDMRSWGRCANCVRLASRQCCWQLAWVESRKVIGVILQTHPSTKTCLELTGNVIVITFAKIHFGFFFNFHLDCIAYDYAAVPSIISNPASIMPSTAASLTCKHPCSPAHDKKQWQQHRHWRHEPSTNS